MATAGSRSGNRNERQGYPRPNPNRLPPRLPSSEQAAPVTPAAPPKPAAKESFLTDEVRELIQLMAASDLTEITIENGAQKIGIRREPPRVVMPEYAPPPARGSRAGRAAPQQPASTSPAEILPISDPGSPPENSFYKVTAPMVGTFYHSPEPGARSFVQEGDMVEKGQVIGIIEAMKIMNEIQSDHAGRCIRLAVENGQPVEYGQTLIVLEPA